MLWKIKANEEKRAVAFRHNRIKNERHCVKNTVPLCNMCVFEEIKVENLWFSSFFIVFYSILVSSLSVPLYASHSSAKDFCSKSVRP